MNAEDRTTLRRMREACEQLVETNPDYLTVGQVSVRAAALAITAVEAVLDDPDHDRIIRENARLREKVQELEREVARLKERIGPIDPGGSDRIDELEQAIDFLRHRAESAEQKRGCPLCSREHGADCDLAFATCTCPPLT